MRRAFFSISSLLVMNIPPSPVEIFLFEKKLKAAYPAIYAELAETSDYRVFRTRNLTKKEK